MREKGIVEDHLFKFGFKSQYELWTEHGFVSNPVGAKPTGITPFWVVDIITGSKKISSNELFALLDTVSEKTLSSMDIRCCPDKIIFQAATFASELRNALALCSYMVERNLIAKWCDHILEEELQRKSKLDEQEKPHEISESDELEKSCMGPLGHGQPDDPPPTPDCISLEEFVRKNKLIKAFKLCPKKFFKELKETFKDLKLSFNILTYAGRKCARGYMKYIIMTHKAKLSWNGDWNLSDMKVRGGSFVISKEAPFELTADRMAENFKKYVELLLPYYCSNEIPEYPFYFNELKADILMVPEPAEPDKLELFQNYMALHWAFMPPVSRSILLDQLFKACESLLMKHEKGVQHLSAYCSNWRHDIQVTPLFRDIYYFRVEKQGIGFGSSYWDLLCFARHFIVHVRDYSKKDGIQLIQDIAIIDLILAQLLASHLSELILMIVQWSNMHRLFYRIWQLFEASEYWRG